MRKIIAATACLWAASAWSAGSPELQGYWHFMPTLAEDRDYVAAVVIDADGRATYDAPLDKGRSANFRGYVASIDARGGVQIVLTDGKQVARMNCKIEAPDTMRCRNQRPDGTISDTYLLKRVRKGVGKLNQ